MSANTTFAPRSSAPKAMRPFPQPTSSSVSPEASPALSSTLSRTVASSSSMRRSYSGSPPVRRVRSQSAQMSVMKGGCSRALGEARKLEEGLEGDPPHEPAKAVRDGGASVGLLGVVDGADELAQELFQLLVPHSVFPREPVELVAVLESEYHVLARDPELAGRSSSAERTICSATSESPLGSRQSRDAHGSATFAGA